MKREWNARVTKRWMDKKKGDICMNKLEINKERKDFADRRKKDNYDEVSRAWKWEDQKKERRKSVLTARHDEGKKGNNDARVFEAWFHVCKVL